MTSSDTYPFWKSKIPFAVLFIVLVFILPKSPKFAYEYKKGSVWEYETLYSQFDFPILKTEEQIMEEKAKSSSGVIAYYRFSDEAVSRSVRAAEGLALGRYSDIVPVLVASLNAIYAQGVISDDKIKSSRSNLVLSDEVLYIQKDKRATKYPVAEVYNESDARAKLLSDVKRRFASVNVDSLFKANGVYELLIPNLLYDKQTTELVHSESSSSVSLTQGFVGAGRLIVSEGEIVTPEIAQMLDSYKAEFEANFGYGGPKILMWLGNILLALLLVIVLYLSIYFTNRTAFRETNKLLFILVVFLVATVAALLVDKNAPSFLLLVPFTLSALWLQAFFKNKLIITVYMVTLMPLLLFTHSGIVLFSMFLLAGIVSIYSFKFFNRGWHQFVSALFIFIALLGSYLAFRLAGMVGGDFKQAVGFLFVSAFVTPLGYPMVYLFEILFNLVSNSRLLELADTSNKALTELEHKAPGSFQHSLQVMTMAETVARAIAADPLLVRAGALYHDIGKENNPQCFVENESLLGIPQGEGYHSKLSAKESAKAIISHMTDGLEIADKLKLPKVIKDFILTHHGTTCASYFYTKYVNEGGNPDDIADFTYPGKKPVTKEQIIVMLCDTVEAASRTLKSTTPEAFDTFVENIVEGKMKAGQFDDADISLRELSEVKATLKSYLTHLYHERVVYPTRKRRAAR